MPEAFACELGVGLADLFQIVQELEEHDPGEHGQTVEIAVEPFVLAHDVARGLDEAAELLGGREGDLRFHISNLKNRFQISDFRLFWARLADTVEFLEKIVLILLCCRASADAVI